MRRSVEEKNLLAKLACGALDGMVGNEKAYNGYNNVFLTTRHMVYPLYEKSDLMI